LVAKAPADGYTLLTVVTPVAINPALFSNLPFDFIRDIAPVIYLARLAYVVVVHPSVPAATLPELIAYAKANPGKINYGSAGAGTPQNITCELFKMMSGVNLIHVPYKGGAPAVADLIAGHVQVIFAPVSEAIPFPTFPRWANSSPATRPPVLPASARPRPPQSTSSMC
jgi:tripartite-type tricarboxylate transporter receptor subunit TctC